MAIAPLPLPEYAKQPKGSIWSFEGRIGRGTFWATFGSLLLANVLVRLLLLGISSGGREMQPLVVVVALPAIVVLLWLALAMQVKRWHDLDNSGWMVLLNLTIIAAPIVLIILGCVKGTVGPNKYGTDPLQTRLGAAVPASEVQAIPAPEAQATLSPVARITGVFFSPKLTFADIAKSPSWFAPMLLLFVIYLGLNFALVYHADWVEVTKDQIAKSKFASRQIDQLPEDQRSRVIEQGAARAKIVRYCRGAVGWPLLILVVSAIYFGAFKLLGGARTNFAAAFAVTTFAHLPMGLRELIAIPVTFLKDPASIDPENFLASNPAAIFGSDLQTWQMVPLTFLDVFGIWALILMAVGFSATDPKKLPLGKSLGIVATVSVTIILFFTMLAWVFS